MRVVSFGNDIKTKAVAHSQQKKESREKQPNARDSFGLPKNYTINTVSAYYPNIKGLKKDQLFDIQYSSALTLSDGSKLVRPVCLSLGQVSIVPSGNKREYEVTVVNAEDKKNPQIFTKTFSEEELLNTKWLSRGKITENKDGKFPYHIEFEDSLGDIKKYNVSKKGCLDILEKNALYI